MPKILKGQDETVHDGSVLEDKWGTAICLGAIFILAFFVRTYFAFELSTKFGTPFLLTGGSDAYYYERIVEYIAFNNRQLLHDSLLNYPIGLHNPRPPLYGWSVALTGHMLAPFVGGDLTKAVHYSLILSTGFWAALTIFPVYLIGRDTFGKKAGMIAAFFLAISSGHLQRSVIGNADHDAIYLFFAISGFYFLMKALEHLNDNKVWVKDWMLGADRKEGLSEFFRDNKKSLLYSAMAGMCVGSVALSWQGYAYVLVVILVYYYIQLFIDKFRYRDSLGVTVCVGITLFLAMAIAAPYYMSTGIGHSLPSRVGTWFDVPLIMVVVAMFGGTIITVSRDYPWILVFSLLGALAAGVMTYAVYFSPTLMDTFTSGAGYFVRTKLYDTIAEAQAPEFSNLVFSFGPATFFLSIIAIALAIWYIWGKWTSNFLFILVWAAFAIYMATSAARFIFNAAPAFALMAGWLVAMIADKADFGTLYRRFKGMRGGFFMGLKRSVKVGHVLAALSIAFLLVMPNVFYGFDAGIPYDTKSDYDQQVSQVLPEFLLPEEYDENSAQVWHLGAFGYGIDKPTDYWPAAWEWLKNENSHLPPEERPAFLSWWDYGFEAVQRAHHPAVADNFQSGYRTAGNALMAQSESELLSVMIIRTLEPPVRDDGGITGRVREILVEHLGDDTTDLVEDAFHNPERYRGEVLSNPDKYHHRAHDIDTANLRYARLMGLLSQEEHDTLVELYYELTEELDTLIKYFAVDTRLFPFSARQTGIFYAPALLSGHRVGGNGMARTPLDFYTIIYVDMQGNEYENPDDIPMDAQIVDIKLDYKPAFYETMLYRTFVGLSGRDAGTTQGIPGVDLENVQPMPAWGLENFRLATRTAYWNPHPPEDVRDHPGDWRAVSLQDAIKYQEEGTGTVDLSAQSYMGQGVVFIEYFHGALVSGMVATPEGTPVPDARVTILDEMGTPHQVTFTDEDGRYEIKSPHGDVSLVISTGGDIDGITQTESIYLGIEQFHVTKEQAMRRKVDRTGDGRWDYLIRKNIEVDTGSLTARVFIDITDSDEYSPGNDTLVPSIIGLSGPGFDKEVDTEGSHVFTGLIPGKYTLYSTAPGTSSVDVMIDPDEHVTEELKVQTAYLEGQALLDGNDILQVELYLKNMHTDHRYVTQVDANGNYSFDKILPGEYLLGVDHDEYAVLTGPKVLELYSRAREEMNLTFTHAYTITGKAETPQGTPLRHQPLSFTGTLGRTYSHTIFTDGHGNFEVKLPMGDYTIYGTYQKNHEKMVHLGTIYVPDDVEYVASFTKGHRMKAHVGSDISPVSDFTLEFVTEDGTIIQAKSNPKGQIDLFLPEDTYTAYGWKTAMPEDLYFRAPSFKLDSERSIDISPSSGHRVKGQVYRDLDFDGTFSEGEGIPTRIYVETRGHTITLISSSQGEFEAVLPNEVVTVRFTKYGFHEKVVRYHPDDDFGPDFAMEAKDVNVQGSITMDGQELHDVTVHFMAVGQGAHDREAVSVNGEYEVYLQPGEYNVFIEHSPEEGISYTLEQDLTVEPSEQPIELDLETVFAVKMYGIISDEDGEPQPATLSFRGDWERETVSEDGTYEIYLPPGSYSMWCADMEGDLVATSRVNIWEPTEYNITLVEALTFSPLVTHDGESREGIIMTFENTETGYIITRITDEDGSFSANLAPGEYEVKVDQLTTEPIDGIQRDVRYSYSDIYDLTVSTSPHISLDRELVHPELSGTLYIEGQGLSGATIHFFGISDEAISTTMETSADGAFSLPISRGKYSIYVKHEGTRGPYSVFQEFLMPDTDTQLNLTLEPAFKLTGTVRKNGVPTSSEITLLDLERAMELEEMSDDTGSYTLILPGGSYRVRAETSFIHDELGELSYMDEQEIELRFNTLRNIELSMVKEYGVEIGTVSARDGRPGETVEFQANIENTGNTHDTFRFSAPTAVWDMDFHPSSLSLGPGESGTVRVSLHLPEDAIVNHPPLSFLAESVNSAETASRTLTVDVEQHYGVTLLPTVSQRTIRDGEIIYKISVENTGNGKDTFDLLVQNKGQLESRGWDVSLDSTTGEISEDVIKTMELVLTPRSQRPSSDVSVQIKATSRGNPSVEHSETYEVELPSLFADRESFIVEGDGIRLDVDSFRMRTAYWVLVVAAVLVGAVFYVRKKRWF